MVTQKFGWDTRTHIDQMSRHKLKRKIVEEMMPLGANALREVQPVA